MSVRGSDCPKPYCSGAANLLVPISLVSSFCSARSSLAALKSISFTTPSELKIIFDGLMSRCMIGGRLPCSLCKILQSDRITNAAFSSDNTPCSSITVSSVFPCIYSSITIKRFSSSTHSITFGILSNCFSFNCAYTSKLYNRSSLRT